MLTTTNSMIMHRGVLGQQRSAKYVSVHASGGCLFGQPHNIILTIRSKIQFGKTIKFDN